jgi:sialic acid synthase SpsE
LGAPAYKIASFEVVDLPLIERVAKTGKPMIISTGLANITEIEEAIETARSAGCNELVVLHCVSGYPAEARDYNLATISDIANRFGVLTGLSDHTIDNTVAISAVALGACVIEKHVTLCRLGGGPDDSFSLERKELAQLCRDSEIAWRAYGSVTYERQESEKDNVIFRRSIYAVKDILAGEPFTSDNIRIIRPGYGLAPKHLKFVLNKRAEEDIERGTPLSWDKVRAQEDWR